MASTSLPSGSVKPTVSPYSFPVVPSPGPFSPDRSVPLANQTTQPANPENNRRANLPPSPLSSPPTSPFASAAAVPQQYSATRTPEESRYDSIGSTYSDGDGDGMPAPLPFLKTAMSRGGIGTGGDGDLPSNRLTSAKRTVSWADLTNTGTALTQVKEYQPEYQPASPLSDSSWEQNRPGCFCIIM